MLNKDTLVKVTNRSYGTLGYDIEDLGIHRNYQPNETKEVTMEEIRKLSYSTAGKTMIEQYLVIDNADAVREILGEVEPEYFYTEEDVKMLLLNGSLDQLHDCLDFASEGVINLVKKYSVDLEINDVSKRKLILEKTGFSVDNAIMVNHAYDGEETEEAAPKTTRRAAPIKKDESVSTGRKAAAPKYKVTSMG